MAEQISPVLLLVFNRPEETRRVFAAIRRVQPVKLYLSADGPRTDIPGETERCEKVRQIATAIDWDCEVKTLFREQNLGCKYAVTGGIDWFFEQEEKGIILLHAEERLVLDVLGGGFKLVHFFVPVPIGDKSGFRHWGKEQFAGKAPPRNAREFACSVQGFIAGGHTSTNQANDAVHVFILFL